MRTRTISKCRRRISEQGYWKNRLDFFRSEAQWYHDEYLISRYSVDRHLSEAYKRKIPWYERKVAQQG